MGHAFLFFSVNFVTDVEHQLGDVSIDETKNI